MHEPRRWQRLLIWWGYRDEPPGYEPRARAGWQHALGWLAGAVALSACFTLAFTYNQRNVGHAMRPADHLVAGIAFGVVVTAILFAVHRGRTGPPRS